ncbi:hypothetical protein EGM_15192, partial [Macaca fascicularis]
DLVGIGEIQKETMQGLNDHLASYLDRVRRLQTDKWRLESKIRHYFKTIEDLRVQIFASTVDSACIILQIDNAHIAADDFRVKCETELAMCQSEESDVHGLRKTIDDTNVTQLQLETEVEALQEELLFMKKIHKEEVKGLQAQIASSGLTVEVDALKSQDLTKIMADIQAQTEESTKQSTEIRAAEMMLTELRCKIQSLEINLNSMRNLKARLENSLREVETHYAMQMEQLNRVLLHLELEMAQTWAEGQHQTQEYEALLNIKIKLEAEIATYHCLLEDGEGFNPGDALDSSNSIQSIQKTTTRRIVDGTGVSETNDTKV